MRILLDLFVVASDGCSPSKEATWSEWHRWEPHIHAPGTVLNNQFGNAAAWDGYLTALESAVSKIDAIAVTDYYVTDSYEEVVRLRTTGRLPDVPPRLPECRGAVGCGSKLRIRQPSFVGEPG